MHAAPREAKELCYSERRGLYAVYRKDLRTLGARGYIIQCEGNRKEQGVVVHLGGAFRTRVYRITLDLFVLGS